MAASPSGSPTTSSFRVLVLGPFELERDGDPIDTRKWQRRVGSLFKLLATAPGCRRLRDDVIDALWPDTTPDAGAGNLRIVAHRLRLALGGGDPSPVLAEQGWIGLNPSYSWQIDLHRFEELAHTPGDDVDRLEAALALYRGEPLAEERYEDWAIPIRERVQRTQRELCLRLAALYAGRGEHEQAVQCFERCLALDALDEEALRGLLTALYSAGRRTDALRRYQQFEQRLAEEMGVPPSQETMQVVQALHAQFAEPPPPPTEVPGRDRPLPIGGFLGALPDGPLAGRDEELERIFFDVDAVEAGAGRLLLLSGEEGAGKTRLAQEVSLGLRDRGFVVATGRCYDRERSIALYPFLEALGLAYESTPASVWTEVTKRWQHLGRLLPGLDATDARQPLASSAGRTQSGDPLRAGVPGSGVRVAPATRTEPAGPALEGEERYHLFRALTGFLLTIADEKPLAILLDDLHWADQMSLDLLQHLARHTRGHRVLLLGTYRDSAVDRFRRPDGDPSTPWVPAEAALGLLIRDLAREGLVERLPVHRLSLEGTAALVNASIGEMEAPEEFTEFVYRRTKGNPFYVEKMLQALGGRYCLVRQIGAGGMGRVFEAVDTQTGQVVAAKIMFARTEADPKALQRFEQEGAVLATLDHHNIVRVYGTFLEEHANCIIMELLEGPSLGQATSASGYPTEPFDLVRIRYIARQVASALACAHDRGIVHRDIKPDNIMLLADDCVKVTDFGIARLVRPKGTFTSLTSTGMTLGTPLYMAPEQIEGRAVDGRTDIYSLGAVLYQLVTGRPPFEGHDPLSIAFKHVHEAPAPLRTVRADTPADWEALILKALAKEPADRFQSAEDIETAIAALGTDRVSPAVQAPIEQFARPAPAEQERSEPKPGPIVQPEAAQPQPEAREARTPPAVGMRRTRRPAMIGAAAVLLAALLGGGFMLRSAMSGGSLPSPGGSGPGQFEGPAGMAVGPRGTVYVADQNNDRVQALSPNGIPVLQFGKQGSGPDELQKPTDVAVDAQGNVYVADYGNSRIQEFSSTGGPITTYSSPWHAPQTGPPPVNGVAVDRSGNVYATMLFGDRVVKLSPFNKLVLQWGQPGTGPGRFRSPTGIAVDSRGNVYVADRDNNRIQKFSPSGQFLHAWGSFGSGPGQFNSPNGVAVDAHGNIYVADQRNNRIEKLSPDGTFLHAWGGAGVGPGQFEQPSGVAVDRQGNIYVSDYYDNRVEKLSPSGKPLWGTHGPRPSWSS